MLISKHIPHSKHLAVVAPCPLFCQIERLPRPVRVLGYVLYSGEVRLEEVGEQGVAAAIVSGAIDSRQVSALAICQGWGKEASYPEEADSPSIERRRMRTDSILDRSAGMMMQPELHGHDYGDQSMAHGPAMVFVL